MTGPTVSQVRSWNPDALTRQASRWRRCGDDLADHLSAFEAVGAAIREYFGGEAADAAHSRAAAITGIGARTVAALRAAADAAEVASADFARARDGVLDAVAAARADGFEVSDDGGVRWLPGSTASAVHSGIGNALALGVLRRRAEEHRVALGAALAELAAVDLRVRSVITASFAELPRDGDPGSGWFGVQSVPSAPPEDARPADARAWWDVLTPARQEIVLASAPASIGNRDGLPAAVRHRANLAHLTAEQAALQEIRQAVAARALGPDGFVTGFARQQSADLTARLAALDTVARTLAAGPDRYLLLLDARAGEQVRAVVAVGDPDTADHVAVTTPGMNASVDGSLTSMAGEAAALRQEAQAQLRATPGRVHEAVSAIAWIGYDPPRTAGSAVDLVRGGVAVAQSDRARRGGAALARFLDGLAVAHTGGGLHLTAIGHSYGSVTTALALRAGGGHPVDDVVVYGSPGLVDVRSPRDLGLGPGRAYAMAADGDVVALLDHFGPGPFGGGPHTAEGFTQLRTDAAVTPDGRHREAAVGHSEYARTGADGTLRVSGYNLAAVVAGLPGNVVRA